ncbi:MAG: hypothetical protein V8S08_04450 [Lachnoclostridium sp.]
MMIMLSARLNRHGGQTDDLGMRGALADGYYFVIRSPCGKHSGQRADIQSVLYLCWLYDYPYRSILVLFFSRRLTDPILELAAVCEDGGSVL